MIVRASSMRRILHLVPAGCLAAIGAALHWSTVALGAQAPTPQPFSVEVDRLPVDVTVLDDDGRPVTDLGPADFQVSVDGTPRRVATAAWVSPGKAAAGPAAPSLPAGFSSNQQRASGRLILLLVDQPSIRFGATVTMRDSIDRFVDALAPGDLVAAIGLGSPGPSSGFTTDRSITKATLGRMNGQRQPQRTSLHGVDLVTALAAQRGDYTRRDALLARECGNEQTQALKDACIGEVNAELQALAIPAAHEGEATLRGLKAVLTGLAPVDAQKVVILVSEGFVLEGSPADVANRVTEAGALADAAQASLYVLHLDPPAADVERGRLGALVAQSADERRVRRQPLELLTTAARGAIFSVTGPGELIFQRLNNELSGYYLLGVEPVPGDLTAARPMKVTISRAGVTVRARRLFGRGRTTDAPRTPRELVASAIANPLILSGLALQTATFSLQGNEPGKVQLLIRAEVGDRYAAPESVALAYIVSDAQGQVVATQSFGGRLAPLVDGLPSPLAYVAGASIVPGDYTLKIAAAVGEVVGSVEHPVHAALTPMGSLTLSDLTVGGPVPTSTPMTPSVDAVVRFGAVHGYVEAYGASAANTKAQFEITSGDDTSPLVSRSVAVARVGASRAIFNDLVPVGQLPPGRYRLRAVVTGEGGNAVLSREFDVPESGRSRSGAASADGTVAAARPLFLPVSAIDMNPAFVLDEALRADAVASLTRKLPFDTFTWFESGMAALRKHDLPTAENFFKEAVQPDVDTTAALAYLGAVFAEAKQDTEAAGIWQTALADGPDYPLLYAWTGEALLRLHDLPAALSILEEGQRRWPDEGRFARPLAILYASMGRGRDALPMLQRHLSTGTPSPASLAMGIEWIYRARVDGVALRSHEEDLTLARQYADAYARAKGPQQGLIKQWLDYLSRP